MRFRNNAHPERHRLFQFNFTLIIETCFGNLWFPVNYKELMCTPGNLHTHFKVTSTSNGLSVGSIAIIICSSSFCFSGNLAVLAEFSFICFWRLITDTGMNTRFSPALPIGQISVIPFRSSIKPCAGSLASDRDVAVPVALSNTTYLEGASL